LLTKEFPDRKDGAEEFVRHVNGAVFTYYDLWPDLSSRKEECAWVELVQEKAGQLRGTLAIGDDFHNEHLDAFGARSLADHLNRVLAYCTEWMAKQKEWTRKHPKKRWPRKAPGTMLAEELVERWLECFNVLPTSGGWAGAYSDEPSPTPFVEVLGFILREIEPDKDFKHATLAKITDRAVANLRKQREIGARFRKDS
jgi:hypothetical protein